MFCLIVFFIHIFLSNGKFTKSKEKGTYGQWRPGETKLLINLLDDEIHLKWHDASGIINKFTLEQKILQVLNEKLGCQKEHKYYLSRIIFLRTIHKNYLDLQCFNSGFGWDTDTKRYTAPDEVWDEYLKKHPTHAHLRYDSVGNFEDLQLIFGNGVATSGSAVGMDDTTDARTFRVEEKTQVRENIIFIEAVMKTSNCHFKLNKILSVIQQRVAEKREENLKRMKKRKLREKKRIIYGKQ
ncbi:unnamed protein product [Brassica oleracea]